MEYIKDFDGWNKVKKKVESLDRSYRYHEKEIWWCFVGVNIGSESCGKGELLLRPVLVYKKINNQMFWGVPLTKKLREDHSHTSFYFNYDLHSAMILQMKPFNVKRLFKKMGKISDYPYEKIKKKVTVFVQ